MKNRELPNERREREMKKALFTLFLSLALMLATVATASADPGAKHTSCAGFGHAFAAWAQSATGAAGDRETGMPHYAQLYPGGAADTLHAEKTTEIPGLTGTPFCDVGD
jgi:hypothetical protein